MGLAPAPVIRVMKILDLVALTLTSAYQIQAFVELIPSAQIPPGLTHVIVSLVSKSGLLLMVAVTLMSAKQFH
jgi:hypothetical protein